MVFEPTQSELSGDVEFLYQIIDPEQDIPSFQFMYYDGGNWQNTNNSVSVLSDSTLRWSSQLDISDQDLENVQLLALPSDQDLGEPDTTNGFNLDNSHDHSVFIVSSLVKIVSPTLNAVFS